MEQDGTMTTDLYIMSSQHNITLKTEEIKIRGEEMGKNSCF